MATNAIANHYINCSSNVLSSGWATGNNFIFCYRFTIFAGYSSYNKSSCCNLIQICSRTVEATISRLPKKGFDISQVISGYGTCPIAPPIFDELRAMDRVNTALIYGATVKYLVNCEDAEIEAVLDQLPFSASRRFGERFYDLFEEGKHDFYIVDKDIHTIAYYEITNLATGRTFRAGKIREDMLKDSLFN